MKLNWRKHGIGYLAIALVITMVGFAAFNSFGAKAESGTTDTANTVVITSPFTEAIKEVKSSVVGVSNYQMVRYSTGGSWSWGFGYDRGESTTQEVEAATGSGVVIAEDTVLTNFHVVEDASSLKITTGDNEFDATLLAYDENLDVAILKADGLNLPAVTLGDSDSLQVGDWAICIGNPLGEQLAGTTTVGIVSALNREVSSTTTDKYGLRGTVTNTMIQVDAAINSGNSGGGMFSVNGELMGIPTLKYTGSAFSGNTVEGIGMCIPINAAKPLIEDVLNGKVTGNATAGASTNASGNTDLLNGKPRMGITITGINTASTAVRTGQLPNGVYVTEVEEGSPAAEAGMQAADIIVDADNTVITSTSQLQEIIAEKNAGDTVEIKVYRVPGLADLTDADEIPEGEYITMTVTLEVVDSSVQQ
ncbi:MAG TPA: trypsin-like peptidase domain-containing protein [Candidatus Egerieenecus merdigallinarum]|nr:trypsin-like peptidase domain-containing protein [Candidatus Egerieenecus merdigallinarum]